MPAMRLPLAALTATLAWADPPVARGHEALAREHGPVFSLAASPRLGILLAGGADVMRRVGVGGQLEFRVHALHLGPLRLGGGIGLGHTQFWRRTTLTADDVGVTRQVTREASLAHTDFALGPSLQLVAGPVLFEGGVTVGLGISRFERPLGARIDEVEVRDDVSAVLRGGGHLAVPIRNGSGVMIGAAVHRYFSRVQVDAQPPADPTAAHEPDTNPFDLMLEVYVGYHFVFGGRFHPRPDPG